MNEELLTVAEVAAFMRVAERTVREWIARNELPATRIGRAYRIKRSDIEALLVEKSNVKEVKQ